VLTAIGDAEEIAGDSYASPLVQNIAGLREAILARLIHGVGYEGLAGVA